MLFPVVLVEESHVLIFELKSSDLGWWLYVSSDASAKVDVFT